MISLGGARRRPQWYLHKTDPAGPTMVARRGERSGPLVSSHHPSFARRAKKLMGNTTNQGLDRCAICAPGNHRAPFGRGCRHTACASRGRPMREAQTWRFALPWSYPLFLTTRHTARRRCSTRFFGRHCSETGSTSTISVLAFERSVPSDLKKSIAEIRAAAVGKMSCRS